MEKTQKQLGQWTNTKVDLFLIGLKDHLESHFKRPFGKLFIILHDPTAYYEHVLFIVIPLGGKDTQIIPVIFKDVDYLKSNVDDYIRKTDAGLKVYWDCYGIVKDSKEKIRDILSLEEEK